MHMTDEDALVEELARAICAASGDTWREGPLRGPGMGNRDSDSLNNHWRHKARAILPIVNARLDAVTKERDELLFAAHNTCEAPEAAAMRYIETLRSNYGSVTILPDNDDADYKSEQTAIDCCGEWTNWQDQRFYGESVLQCLAKAAGVLERAQALGGNHEG